MKVELEKLRMGHSPLTDKIFVGTVIKEGVGRSTSALDERFKLFVGGYVLK